MSLERKGILFAISSGILYGLLGFFSTGLLESGMSVPNVSFWRFFVAFLFAFVIFLLRHQDPGHWRGLFALALIGGVFYSIPSSLFLNASRYIGTGQAMVIFFTFPVFVMLFNWLFLGQPLKPPYLLSFMLIVVGLALLVDLHEIKTDFVGIGYGLIAAFFYAIYIFLSKRLNLPAFNSTMMVLLGCCASSLFFASVDTSLTLPTTAYQWLFISLLGIVCSVIPILLMLEAMKHISSDKASLLSVLEPLFTVLFGVILLGEELTVRMVLGMALILLGATALVFIPSRSLELSKS